MVNGAVVILHKMDTTLNVRDMLGCQVENDVDVIISHEIGEWLKFGIHMKMGDGEVRGVADAKGLVECIAKQGDGAVVDGTNGAKFNVFG